MNLHKLVITARHPHPDVPMLTEQVLSDLMRDPEDEDEETYGVLSELWLEGPRPLPVVCGLWTIDGHEFIINAFEFDTPFDLRSIATGDGLIIRELPYDWYVGTESCLHLRLDQDPEGYVTATPPILNFGEVGQL